MILIDLLGREEIGKMINDYGYYLHFKSLINHCLRLPLLSGQNFLHIQRRLWKREDEERGYQLR